MDAIASQILDLWEAVMSQKREKIKDSKLHGILTQLNSFVKESKNDRYLVGDRVSTWKVTSLLRANLFSAHMGGLDSNTFYPVFSEWSDPGGIRARIAQIYKLGSLRKNFLRFVLAPKFIFCINFLQFLGKFSFNIIY